jgi:ribonuclease Z
MWLFLRWRAWLIYLYIVFDTADGTLPRLQQSPLKIANISRIFISHMHADHTLGLVSILTTVMSGVGTSPESLERLRKQGTSKKANMSIICAVASTDTTQAEVNIYGPAGLRELIRTTLRLTSVNLGGAYAVHELYEQGGQPSVPCGEVDLHTNEAAGMDLDADQNGVWRDILIEGNGKHRKGWNVSAGPIDHRGECSFRPRLSDLISIPYSA